jgi:pilus assembly protein TadC
VKLPEINVDLFFNRRFQIALCGISVTIALVVGLFGYTLYATQIIPEFTLHIFAVIGLILGLILPAYILILHDRRRNEIDRMLPRVLEEISEGLMSGMTLIESIEESSKREYGFITKELRMLVGQMSWGVSIEEAFENFSKRVGTDMAKKTTVLLLSAIHLGGDMKSVFLSTSSFLRKALDVKADRNDQLRPYLMIVYVTLVVFLAMMVMLYGSISGLLSIKSPILKVQMTKEQLRILLFDLSVMEGLFGGLIAAKLSEGTIFPGLKHSIIMLLINTLAFMTFVT